MKQSDAFELLSLGYNVFLTGAAGSGKTFLLNKYIRYLRKHDVGVAVTASTGIAATHIGGQTIHSWCGLGIRTSLSDKELEEVASNKRVKRNVKRTKVLVIDEISMLHASQLDMVHRITSKISEREEPFGGLQVVLCGDFFQLPPIAKSANDTKFAFESSSLRDSNFLICYLSEQHRQRKDKLLDILNEIRSGTAGEQTKVPLRTCYKRQVVNTKGESVQPTLLYAKNINVDAVNERKLDELQKPLKTFRMTSRGFSGHVESLIRNCLAPEQLQLKIGAEVMFVKNDVNGAYVNGSQGVVVDFNDDTGYPEVQLLNGKIVTARPSDWSYEEFDIVRATITQIPLRLAWAITIHKSQGMTLDAAEIDLSDAFEPGMGYVALSRVSTLEGVRLMGLNDVALTVNSKVLNIDGKLQEQSLNAEGILWELSEEECIAQKKKVLFSRFKGVPYDSAQPRTKQRSRKTDKIPTHEITRGLLAAGKSLQEIAEERNLKNSTIITHLEKLKGLKILPAAESLKPKMSAEDFAAIVSEFEKSEDGQLTPIFEHFKGKYSYEDLRLVRLLGCD